MKHSASAAQRRAPANKSAAGLPTAKNRSRFIIMTFAAAVLVILVAFVLRNVSDTRSYNDYMEQARASYNAYQYENALSYLRKAAAVDETDECRGLIVNCYEILGNYEKALQMLRKMDTSDEAVAERIASLENRQAVLSETGSVSVAGKQYAANATVIALDDMGLTDSELPSLTQLCYLNALTLSGNALRDIEPLGALAGLTTLDLSDNNIDNLLPLNSLTALRTLYLDNNPITDLSPLYALTNLTSLSIKGIELTQRQLEALSRALPTCAIHSDAAEEDIPDISLGGSTFKADVTQLNLSGMGLRDISVLAGCTGLETLDLSNNMISDLSPLMSIPSLKWLNVSGNELSDVNILMGMTTLTCVNAADNHISNTVALGQLSQLKELYLDNNPITNFAGLRRLSDLVTLGLSGTGLTDDGLAYLYGLDMLSTLNIENNAELSGEGVSQLQGNIPGCQISHSDLRYYVSVEGYTAERDAVEFNLSGLGLSDISGLSAMTALKTLYLGNNRLSNIYPFQYCEFKQSLTYLDLSGNIVGDITPLADLTSLETLILSNNCINSIQPLLVLQELRTLYVDGNGLTEEQIDTLRSGLPSCDVVA